MAASQIDPSTLTLFQHAAAGHEGPLSDPSGTLFIKPCTDTEISFYETANASYPALAAFLPTYLGTLSLQQQQPAESEGSAASAASAATRRSAANSTIVAALKGKKLNTDMHIVLHNAAASFSRANVLDLKLGARLWDDDASLEKRARLDTVARATTSGSLGFRIAGMRTWQGDVIRPAGTSAARGDGDLALSPGAAEAAAAGFGELDPETRIFSYNKLFGRQFRDHTDVINGFRQFLLVPAAGIASEHALGLLGALLEGTRQLERVLAATELRMYSASILYTYEGDGREFDRKYALQQEQQGTTRAHADIVVEEVVHSKEAACNEAGDTDDDTDVDDDDDDDMDDPNAQLSIKLIDFAHAHFVPGQGADENILQGVRSIVKVLEALQKELLAGS